MLVNAVLRMFCLENKDAYVAGAEVSFKVSSRVCGSR